jgi:hypothetical protein
MQKKIINQSEVSLPELTAALFDQNILDDLLENDISPIVREVQYSVHFTDLQRAQFWAQVEYFAQGSGAVAELAQKYLLARHKAMPLQDNIPRLQDTLTVKDLVQQLWTEKEIFPYLQKIIISLPVFTSQRALYQNKFHPEGSCLAHTQQVAAALMALTGFFTSQIADGHHYPLLRKACQDLLYGLLPQDKPMIRASLERRIDGAPRVKLLLLAGIMHDIGKPATAKKTVINGAYKIFKIDNSYYFDHKFSGHEEHGAQLFLEEACSLGLTGPQTDFVYELIRCHKDITDVVKQARKQPAQSAVFLQEALTRIKEAYVQKDIFYEAVFLFMADSFGKASVQHHSLVFTPDIEELKTGFYTILRAHRQKT